VPRAKPKPDEAPVTLSFSVPFWMAAEVRDEVGSEYGAQAALFRRIWQHWRDQAKWRQRYEAERTRRLAAERLLQRARDVLIP
jgi:hypothetical protein